MTVASVPGDGLLTLRAWPLEDQHVASFSFWSCSSIGRADVALTSVADIGYLRLWDVLSSEEIPTRVQGFSSSRRADSNRGPLHYE